MSSIEIHHTVHRLRQPDEHSCWATCIAMKLGAVRGRCYTIEGIKSTAVDSGVNLHSNGSVATDPENMKLLGQIFDIRILQNAGTVQIHHLLPTLRRSPVILFGAFSSMSSSTSTNHAVVLHEMWGDSTDSTAVGIVDPFNASFGDDHTNDFMCSWADLCNRIITRLDYVSAV